MITVDTNVRVMFYLHLHMFMNVVAIMIDYVGFLGLFAGSGRFCAPISLF